jgi:DNA-binding transcriptional ArsR family regulator
MGLRKNGRGLHFPCECVSVQRGYSDPWAAITQNKLLNDGTKERILNAVARQPRTIARLAEELGLSQPAIHTHVNDMVQSELLREATAWKKSHPAENFYEPNFPVVKNADRVAVEPLCEEIAARIAEIFESRQEELKQAIERTGLADKSLDFYDLSQYLYACAQRGARKLLEERGVLPRRKKHRNGAEWLFWAEEPNTGAAHAK